MSLVPRPPQPLAMTDAQKALLEQMKNKKAALVKQQKDNATADRAFVSGSGPEVVGIVLGIKQMDIMMRKKNTPLDAPKTEKMTKWKINAIIGKISQTSVAPQNRGYDDDFVFIDVKFSEKDTDILPEEKAHNKRFKLYSNREQSFTCKTEIKAAPGSLIHFVGISASAYKPKKKSEPTLDDADELIANGQDSGNIAIILECSTASILREVTTRDMYHLMKTKGVVHPWFVREERKFDENNPYKSRMSEECTALWIRQHTDKSEDPDVAFLARDGSVVTPSFGVTGTPKTDWLQYEKGVDAATTAVEKAEIAAKYTAVVTQWKGDLTEGNSEDVLLNIAAYKSALLCFHINSPENWFNLAQFILPYASYIPLLRTDIKRTNEMLVNSTGSERYKFGLAMTQYGTIIDAATLYRTIGIPVPRTWVAEKLKDVQVSRSSDAPSVVGDAVVVNMTESPGKVSSILDDKDAGKWHFRLVVNADFGREPLETLSAIAAATEKEGEEYVRVYLEDRREKRLKNKDFPMEHIVNEIRPPTDVRYCIFAINTREEKKTEALTREPATEEEKLKRRHIRWYFEGITHTTNILPSERCTSNHSRPAIADSAPRIEEIANTVTKLPPLPAIADSPRSPVMPTSPTIPDSVLANVDMSEPGKRKKKRDDNPGASKKHHS